jgi:effector-binding domain-containing protein
MNTAPESVQLVSTPAIAIRGQLPMSKLTEFFSAAYQELGAVGADKIAGPPFAIYHSLSAEKVDVSAGFPLREPVPARGRVLAIQLDGGPAVQLKHIGPYEDLGATYVALEKWLLEHHRSKIGPIREVYLTPPSSPPTDQVTMVIQTVRE